MKWRNNQNFLSACIRPEPITAESHRQYMASKVKTGKVIQFIIIFSSSDTPVGTVYLKNIDQVNHAAELSMFDGENDENNWSIASDVLKLMVQYGFDKLHLYRIYVEVLKWNVRLMRIYEKAGFMVEGFFHDQEYIHGDYVSVMYISVINVANGKGYYNK